jgi:hypothetical protein
MQPKSENNLKEYAEFLDCRQHNQKESTSNNSNTFTKKNEVEPEIKEERKTNPHIFIYSAEEKTENEYENLYENNNEDNYVNGFADIFENDYQNQGNNDDKFTEFYDVCDNSQKNPEKDK